MIRLRQRDRLFWNQTWKNATDNVDRAVDEATYLYASFTGSNFIR